MQVALVAILAICVPTLVAGRAPTNKSFKSFVCPAQGNYPDPDSCDNYIACTTNLDAVKMPCPAGLWFRRDTDPQEQGTLCDYPQNVECDLSGETTAPTTPKPDDGSTTPNGGSETTIEDDSTTTARPGGNCPPGIVPNVTSCDPKDCTQCGHCDKYYFCHKVDKVWVEIKCQEKTEASGTVLTENKLFWDKGGNSHGGICVPFDDLTPALKIEYKNDPTCKEICEFLPDDNCDQKYWYKNAELEEGAWSVPAKPYSCKRDTKWDQDTLSCKWCLSADRCNCA